MKFIEMRNKLTFHFNEMMNQTSHLFEVNLDKDKLWDLYLENFPENENLIYRVRKRYDCSSCKHFIRTIGNVVMIKDGKVTTIWDFKVDSDYQKVLDTLSEFVKSHLITDVFVCNEKKVGTFRNFEHMDDDSIKEWDHFHLELPENIVHTSRYKTINEVRGEYRDNRNVFKRALDEISGESISTVLELIDSDMLYRGLEFRPQLINFKRFKERYDKLSSKEEKDLWSWEESFEAAELHVARIGNSVIGTLLYDISEGEDLEKAVKKYESKVAPENYHRPKAIFTQKMLDDAKQKITELGYLESLGRRYAVVDDININDILFVNRNISRIAEPVDVFAEMSKDAIINPKRFDRVEEIGIEDFITTILPNTTSLEAYLENKHSSNMVSLIAPENIDSKSMFKWGNNFSWAYAGNVTDSLMKERVKAAGGKVDGDLRCSIQWNDLEQYNANDLDLHCYESSGYHIYYGSSCNNYSIGGSLSQNYSQNTKSPCGGLLDVDNRRPSQGIPAVENIVYADRKTMRPGMYRFIVHNYCHRGGNDGFRAEIEFDGNIYSFDYRGILRDNESIEIAVITVDENKNFTINPSIPTTDQKVSSKEVWGLNTNQFVPVTVTMLSPNYWNEQDGSGNKHYFFMLKDCKNPDEPNGFYNEFLKSELLEHKRVFEALGSKMRVNYVEDQLSGLGFSSTKRNDLVVKVKDKSNTEKVLRIKF